MKDRSLTLASLLAAGAASLCCIGPVATAGLGLGAFGAAALFEGLRPYFLGVTALLLAGSFYLSYRRNPDAACADGSCAPPPKKNHKQRALLWLATAVVAALVAFPQYRGAFSADLSAEAAAFDADQTGAEAVAVFAIEGMTCGGCAAGVQAFLDREEGVVSAEVDYEKGSARVHYQPTKTSAEKIIAAIGTLGYSAKLNESQS